MKRYAFLIGLLSLCSLLAFATFADGEAWILTIDGEINSGTVTYLRRGIHEATEAGAGVVVLVLATPGGTLDAAVESRRILLDATIPTVAYVSREAFSAGAAIAIACETILFSPGGVIGAATPVTFVGETMREAPEKVISATRVRARLVAATGRTPIVPSS